MKKLILIAAVVISLLGCAHVVPRELREKADRQITPADLLKNPDKYKGKFVILGGIIAGSTNTSEGTYIEVVEKPLDRRGRPKDTDTSYGRFLILYNGYLDTAIYAQGREITVAGEVQGKQVRPLGDIQYTYAVIKSTELYLFEPGREQPIHFGIGIGVIHSF